MERNFKRTNEAVSKKIRALRRDIEKEFGSLSKVTAALVGPILMWTSRWEDWRLARGKTYEPRTIIERRNWAEAKP